DDSLLIDLESKGVKNVMVWLADPNGGKLPIHPQLAPVPKNIVQIDWPGLQFRPRITMMREGQVLGLINNRPGKENVPIVGSPEVNSTVNKLIAAGMSIKETPKAEKRPLILGNDIRPWMSGRIGVFDHPYFALTDKDGYFRIKDAPAGNLVIYVLHEKAGW